MARRLAVWAVLCLVALGAQALWRAYAARGEHPVSHAVCPRPVARSDDGGPAVLACATDVAIVRRLVGPAPKAGDGVLCSAKLCTVAHSAMADSMRLSLGLALNINRSDVTCLAQVPGLGPSGARAIVAHRALHGPFAQVTDLRRVRGIGPVRLARAQAHVQAAAPWGPGDTAGSTDAAGTAPPAPGPGPKPEALLYPHAMKREWLVDVVARLPQGALSRAWGWLARVQSPTLFVAAYKRVFARAVGVDLTEATEPMSAYPSLEAMFVRRLKAGARPIDASADAVVSPVDALVGASGTVQSGTMLQLKGRSYSVARLLADGDAAARFEGGSYATFYLAPRDYHRIHAPVAGDIAEARLIPGALMPVFEESLAKVDELFARNERLITYIDTPHSGRVAVIKVGATLVGRITVTYDATLVGNVGDGRARAQTYASPTPIAKGAELGAFELGSTVVVLAEPGALTFNSFAFGQRVVVGQRVGTLTGAKAATTTPGGAL